MSYDKDEDTQEIKIRTGSVEKENSPRVIGAAECVIRLRKTGLSLKEAKLKCFEGENS